MNVAPKKTTEKDPAKSLVIERLTELQLAGQLGNISGVLIREDGPRQLLRVEAAVPDSRIGRVERHASDPQDTSVDQ